MAASGLNSNRDFEICSISSAVNSCYWLALIYAYSCQSYLTRRLRFNHLIYRAIVVHLGPRISGQPPVIGISDTLSPPLLDSGFGCCKGKTPYSIIQRIPFYSKMTISKQVSRIAVIGAGPSGLAAVKYGNTACHFSAEAHGFLLTIFQVSSCWEMLW